MFLGTYNSPRFSYGWLNILNHGYSDQWKPKLLGIASKFFLSFVCPEELESKFRQGLSRRQAFPCRSRMVLRPSGHLLQSAERMFGLHHQSRTRYGPSLYPADIFRRTCCWKGSSSVQAFVLSLVASSGQRCPHEASSPDGLSSYPRLSCRSEVTSSCS